MPGTGKNQGRGMSGSSFSIAIEGYDETVRRLKQLPINLRKQMYVMIGEVAKETVEAAKSLIEPYSPRIASTIRVAKLRGLTAVIKVGGRDVPKPGAPHAAAFEHQGTPGTFQHPVFGHRDRMVSQQAHPYFHPAVYHNIPKYQQKMIEIGQRVKDMVERGID